MAKWHPSRVERVIAVAAIVVLGVGTAIFVPRGLRSDEATTPELSTFRAVCRSAEQASVGEYRDAHRVFVDQAHEGLHQLAADLTTINRQAEARLLESKARVEAFGNTFNSQTAAALAELEGETATAVAALTRSAAPRC